ncbi:putative 37s ribosomal protein s11 protein [Neofusicoccum parvum]|uniref:37s ribosomal protein s11 protein n=1 Tax=Neofusicoccum parvum TaxID=310453 RepID=A0ACB5RYA0_9PEZI|nr:putative 37s ribosomal protein s11 protein [Neofusicoccum parvum]
MVLENTAQRAFSALGGSICLSCRASQSLARPAFVNTTTPRSLFSTTTRRAADGPSPVSSLLSAFMTGGRRRNNDFSPSDMLSNKSGFDMKPGEASLTEEPEPHHLHIVSSKHNTHLTLSRPDKNSIISVAAGNIGFRKAGRSTYDAAYQLAAFVLSTIQERGLLMEIKRLELVFRGFGDGREAVRKAIMGPEGMMIRNRIVRVTDTTRLKFGGTRSKKPRRLG